VSDAFEPIDVAVVGGGISGLSAAFWCKRRGRTVALFEASDNVGGSITTARTGQYIADGGPQSFVLSDNFRQLIADAALERFVLPSSPLATMPYLYHRGKLVAAPRSPQAILATPLLSPLAKLRILGEPFVPRAVTQDETIASFVERRAGREALESVVAPFVSGVFAGDTTKLSLASAFPMAAKLEQEYGSIIRGMLAQRRQRPANGAPQPTRRQSVGFAGGNDVLPRSLAAALGADFTVKAPVKAIWQRGQWMELLIAGQPDQRVVARSIIIATPAYTAADLLEPLEPDAAAALREIEYPAVIQIALAYPRDAIGIPLDGFGFLASRREGLKILGCVWNSVMFPDRCPPGEVLVTVFLGGATDPQICSQSDEELVRAAHNDLKRAMQIKDVAPHVVAGFRWQQAIPQYTVGHAQRRRVVMESLARLAHVRLCGNYLRGPAVSDCLNLAHEIPESLP
jgi:oxygen-dependent protoporphyrinogen oxidase